MTSVIDALNAASKFQASGKNRQAQTIYNQILKQCPQHPEALHGLGVLAQKAAQFEIAEKCFKSSLNASPNSTKTLFRLGFLYQLTHRTELSKYYYRKVLNLDSNDIAAQNNLGYVLQKNGQLDEAIALYQSVLSIAPECGEADINLANCLYQKGELHSADHLKYANLNLTLGLEKQKSGTFEDALSYIEQAIELNPRLVAAHLQRGIILRDRFAQLDSAVSSLQTALALAPELSEIQLELGRTYQLQGQFPEAIAAFKQWICLNNPRYAQLTPPSESDDDLTHYAPPPIHFERVKVGHYQFPAIPLVTESQQERPFWSVIIPALNRPEYFLECLASVLAQWSGDQEMEILVLDNGSTPPLFDMVRSLGKGLIRYYRFPKTVPLQENWNTMVALSKGQWIFLLQHDDYVRPHFFERFRNSLEHCPNSVGAAFTDYENIDEQRRIIFSQTYGLEGYRGIVDDWVSRIGVSCPLSPPSVVIRRAAYERLGGYKLDLPYTCDWEFYKRVASFYDWWHEPGILAHYREYANSLTLKDSLNGVAGKAHRLAIEMSHSYLPEDVRDDISQRSRTFHFDWCMKRTVVATTHREFLGAMTLAQEALLIDPSKQATDAFLGWMATSELAPLREEFERRLISAIAHNSTAEIHHTERIGTSEPRTCPCPTTNHQSIETTDPELTQTDAIAPEAVRWSLDTVERIRTLEL